MTFRVFGKAFIASARPFIFRAVLANPFSISDKSLFFATCLIFFSIVSIVLTVVLVILSIFFLTWVSSLNDLRTLLISLIFLSMDFPKFSIIVLIFFI